jgi:type II restriction enzyme
MIFRKVVENDIQNNPSLFGLANSNRDFTIKESWGKNQFNSSFPAALCCYLHHKKLNANYLKIENGAFSHGEVHINEAFGIEPNSEDAYYVFESAYAPFQQFVVGTLPRTDLVVQKKSTGQCLAGIEVKLTALPDNTTCELSENEYGSEIVVRPNTIVYLACSIARSLGNSLSEVIDNKIVIEDWTEAEQVLPHIATIIESLRGIFRKLEHYQTPFLLQPIWKTNGKSPQLSDQCLDVFFWSNAGFTNFITEIANSDTGASRITRQTRTAIWLYKMLLDTVSNGKFNHHQIIDSLSYNTKNDKAFASAGNITNRFMTCNRLKKPAIEKDEIKNIILGGGQNLLSPERRFDAIVYNSPELFN